MNELIVYGATISQDRDGYVCLTDLWRVAGKINTKRPGIWQKLPTTEELVAALVQNVKFFNIIAETRTKSAIYTKKGRRSSTSAHHILALAYAEYLNPEIGVEVRDIALRYWAGDVTLLDAFARERRERFKEDGDRVFLREETRWFNQVLAVHAREAGVRSPSDFAEFHNSGYRGLYNGEDENAIHKRKSLRKDQHILDHMTSPEAAAANWFRTTQAEQRLKYQQVATIKEACHIHCQIGQIIRDVMQRIGSPMPETMPTADNIRDARRRIAAYRKSLKLLRRRDR
ncbi:MAG: KilA-N domain-containing protein [Hyphomicrobiaceae bacterium]